MVYKTTVIILLLISIILFSTVIVFRIRDKNDKLKSRIKDIIFFSIFTLEAIYLVIIIIVGRNYLI